MTSGVTEDRREDAEVEGVEPYGPPALAEIGSVEDVTHGTPGGGNDFEGRASP